VHFSRSITAAVTALAALASAFGAPATAEAPVRHDVPVAAGEGVWLAGDLHVHTPYSHDSYGGPDDDNTGFEEAYLLGNTVEGNFLSAAAKGLDYLAISDHNDIRAHNDPGFGAGGVTPIHAYENSLDGHAQMLGARKIYDAGDKGAGAVSSMAEELHGHGGAFQVNHPAEGSTDFPHDVDWGYGYQVVPKTVEVWNISRLWQPPMPSASSNDDAVRYWEGWLDRGYRVGATGGSDSHYIWTSLTLLGSPTTWVYAAENNETAILDALRAGRTFISHQPPTLKGPRLFLEGDEDSDGEFESMVGDAVAPGSSMRVRVEGAPGSFLRIITNGGELAFDPVPVTGPTFEHAFTMPETSTWVRAELFDPDLAEERKALCDAPFGGETTYCRNMLAILAMTSAMYYEEQAPTVLGTTLDYTGQTRGRGSRVNLAAELLDENSTPVVGETVRFSILGKTYEAITDSSGVGATTAEIADHGRSATVHVLFDGTERYAPSHANAQVTWGSAR
jgi:hypothetical protein